MLWIVLAVGSLFFLILLYACLVAGARADREMNEIMNGKTKSVSRQDRP